MTTHLTSAGPPPSPAELDAIERQLRVQLPADYRTFLLKHNGGTPTPGWFCRDEDTVEVTHLNTVAELCSETAGLRAYGVSQHYVAIGAIFEELTLALSVRSHAVFWNPSNSDLELVRLADSFADLFSNLDYVAESKPWMELIDNNDITGLTRWLDVGGSASATGTEFVGSALEHAAALGRLEIVKLLLARGAKPGTSYRYAELAGHADVAKVLAPLTPWWKFW